MILLQRFSHSKSTHCILATSLIAASFTTSAIEFEALDATFSLSGQINRALTVADNGKKTDAGFVDNDGWPNEIFFTGHKQLDNAATIGFNYNLWFTNLPSSAWDINNNGRDSGRDSGSNFDSQEISIWYAADFGRIKFGKMATAADSATSFSYAGTTWLGGGRDVADYAGGLSFLDADGQSVAQIGYQGPGNSAFAWIDGLGFQNGLVYKSPNFGGLSVATGVYDGGAFDVLGEYETHFADQGRFMLRGVYADSQNLDTDPDPNGDKKNNKRFKEYGALGAVLFPNGFNAAVAYKHRDYSDKNMIGTGNHRADTYFGQLGYRLLNRHNFSLDYSVTKDFLNAGSKFEAVGLAYVYNWTKYNIDLFTSYHRYMLSGANQKKSNQRAHGVHDIDQIFSGIRLAFD